MARGPRIRIGEGIYRDNYGIAAVVTVDRVPKEIRFPPDTPIKTIRRKMETQRRKMRERRRAGAPKPGTLAADALRYKRQIQHLANASGAWAEVKAWIALYGHLHRDAIDAESVRVAVGAWTQAGVSPKTILNRMTRLARLYRVLDGKDAETPCDDVERPRPNRRPIIRVPDAVLSDVAATLEMAEQHGFLRDAKTRARFLVLVTTGRRPCEIKRAKPEDVDLTARVWVPRDAKGGYTPGIYLADDALAAWKLFAATKAWGYYRVSSFDRTIRNAGWPANVPPYMARHTYGITLSEAGIDLADVQTLMGHKHQSTTRRHYVPVLGSRIQAAAEKLDGRLRLAQSLGTPEKV